MYQRSKIQEESMYYEGQKASGELPIIGVNTYLNPESEGQMGDTELIRSTEEEKNHKIALERTHALNQTQSGLALKQATPRPKKG